MSMVTLLIKAEMPETERGAKVSKPITYKAEPTFPVLFRKLQFSSHTITVLAVTVTYRHTSSSNSLIVGESAVRNGKACLCCHVRAMLKVWASSTCYSVKGLIINDTIFPCKLSVFLIKILKYAKILEAEINILAPVTPVFPYATTSSSGL